MSRLCPQCGNPFEPTNAKQWWCKTKCYQAAYGAANRAGFLKQQAAYRAAKRERIPQDKDFLAKWSKVDWSKQNYELAIETGFNREYIRQIRRQVGAPQPNHPRRRRTTAEVLQRAKDNLNEIKGLSYAELERKFGLAPHWRNSPLHDFLKPFLRDGRLDKKHPWHLMNFRLPSADLNRIWRLPHNMSAAYRYRKKLPPSEWSFKANHLRFSERAGVQAYWQAVKAEESNAAKYFAPARRRSKALTHDAATHIVR